MKNSPFAFTAIALLAFSFVGCTFKAEEDKSFDGMKEEKHESVDVEIEKCSTPVRPSCRK